MYFVFMSKLKSEIQVKGKIRILRIISRMNIGGPAVQISGLMRGLDSRDFEHILLTGHCESDESDYLVSVAPDVGAIRINGLGRSLNLIADLRAFIRILKVIREFRHDIIHTHTAKAGVLGRIASIASGHSSIRVHTFHGHLLNGYFSQRTTQLVIIVEKFLALFTHSLITVGENVCNDLIKVGIGRIEKFVVIPPGLTLNQIPTKEHAKQNLCLETNSLHCSLIGRVTWIKRPDRFLDVVEELLKRGIEIKFIIAGSGSLLEETKSRIKENSLPVVLLGWRSDIEHVLAASDIVILTSDNEGTPLSLIQAGMVGIPVVSTNVGSVSEIVLNAKTGFVTSLDVVELADAIQLLVENPDLRAKMGSEAKEFTLENFSVDRLVNDHARLYRRIFASRAIS